jgi:ribonuclease Z
MKIITLGTGSGKPTLRRNVSAVALVREGEWLLFDCGEGTQLQIMRAGLAPSKLAAIFITHLHGDHFNGLAGLLSTMGLDGRDRNLTLVGPPGIRQYLDTLAGLKILNVSFPLQVCEFASFAFRPKPGEATVSDSLAKVARVVYESEKYFVEAMPLLHRIFTLGYRVQEKPRPGRFNVDKARSLGIPEGPLYGRLQSGHSVQLSDGRVIHPSDVLGPPRPGKAVAYCTDTRPCDSASWLSRDADLLIHEATFTEDLASEAYDYGHSTARQAASIARDSNVRRLLITHFSPRYSDASALLDEARAIFPETVLAEDLLELEV